jgi:hypothetical protein
VSDDDTQDDDNLNTSRVPALRKDGFDCPRCGAYASQSWASLNRVNSTFYDSRRGIGQWTSAQCGRCYDYSVWRDERMVYPTSGLAPVAHPQMPPEARVLYEEAREVVGISRRAGTALARAALERLLRTLDPIAGKQPNLATRIERILPSVPGPLAQMLTVIRVAGNSTLHVADEPDEILVLVLDPGETEVVELIFETINDLVEELIAKPAKVTNLYSKIPASMRERVDEALAKRLATE